MNEYFIAELKDGTELDFKRRCNPVSYTHLDVYKRQIQQNTDNRRHI